MKCRFLTNQTIVNNITVINYIEMDEKLEFFVIE